MLGTIVNVIAILIGTFVGRLLKRGIKEEYKDTVMNGIGLAVVVIGITGAIKSQEVVLVIASLVLGSIIGEIIAIEHRLEQLGSQMEKGFGNGDSNFSKGFVTASLIYCIGAMAIVGSLESGLMGNHNTLYAKSMLDGIMSMILASTLGIGVAFSAIPVFVYQGLITLLASIVKDILTPEVILEMSAVGGVLILGIGINILGIKKIKVGNMLPAVFVPIVHFLLLRFF